MILTRVKILAYLGFLKRNEWVRATKLCNDMSLRYTTTKNTLAKLEFQGLVAHKIETENGVVALYCIPANTTNRVWDSNKQEWKVVPFIPPEWDEKYGKHPNVV